MAEVLCQYLQYVAAVRNKWLQARRGRFLHLQNTTSDFSQTNAMHSRKSMAGGAGAKFSGSKSQKATCGMLGRRLKIMLEGEKTLEMGPNTPGYEPRRTVNG